MRDKNIKRLVLLLVVIAFLQMPLFADLEKGKGIFAMRCASCHGNAGKGDGPAAAAFPAEQRPRDLSNLQNFKVAKDDAKLKELISKGGPAMGLSPLMPPQGDLSGDDLNSLVEFVNSLRK